MDEKVMYTCPMHPEVRQDHPGSCPKCGMKLVKESELSSSSHTTGHEESNLKTYFPLIVIIGLIFLTSVVLSIKDALSASLDLRYSMAYFMSGFFLVFSGFKLLDLKGFAQGYSTYDLLARKWFTYGYIYPFLELLLGVFYILFPFSFVVNAATLLLMSFSGLGVLESISKKRKFQCACLGTVIKVPLTTVTLVEDFGMAAMALFMLFIP